MKDSVVWLAITLFLCGASFVGGCVNGKRNVNSKQYERGVKFGVEQGLVQGFEDGFKEGYLLGYKDGSGEDPDDIPTPPDDDRWPFWPWGFDEEGIPKSPPQGWIPTEEEFERNCDEAIYMRPSKK